ncbi:MAG: hypothetical protein AAF125_17210 [Chloroflexota bacterium]
MAADFKSHVLRRDEKGFLGVPFKRMLLGGVSGGMSYMLTSLLLGLGGISVGVVVGITAILLTGTRGGIPLWERLRYRWRGSLLLAAARDRSGLAARICRWLDLPVGVVRLDGGVVFAPPTSDVAVDLREWITFAHAGEDDGLVFVDSPMEASRQ